MNRQKSALEYQKRIQKALSFIGDNLDRPLTLSEVANAACFSEYHFHRIFSVLMNESVGEYITRKKLEKAAIKLAYSAAPKVSDVAVEYGYASVSSFSKAFNQWFGCRPTEFNQIRQRLDSGKGKLQTKYEKSVDANQLFVNPATADALDRFESLDQKVEIKTLSEKSLSFLTSPGGYELNSIRKIWMDLLRHVEDAHIALDDCERFAISHDHPGLTPSTHCRYDACVSVPEGHATKLALPRTTLPAGRYAVYPVEGPEDSILPQYLEFYTVWMPQSGYEPDNFPVVEHYLPPFDYGHIKVELWAKINRLTPG